MREWYHRNSTYIGLVVIAAELSFAFYLLSLLK